MQIKLLLLLLVAFTLRSLASFAVHVDHDGPIIEPIVRRLSHRELNSRTWSQNATVLRKANGVTYILHNYTVDHEQQTGRWTKREIAHSHQRRAFGWDKARSPTHLWDDKPAAHQIPWENKPVWIQLCFKNQEAKNALETAVEAAVCRWRVALGSSAGVQFVWVPTGPGLGPRLCWERIQSNSHQVSFRYAEHHGGSPGVGKYRNPFIDTEFGALLPQSDGYTLTSRLTQELGRILGLRLETQRPDATQHLRLYCDRIPGYQELAQYLAAGQPGEHAWDGGTNGNRDLIMWDDFCHHGELNLIEKYYHIWKGGRFVPYSEDYNQVRHATTGQTQRVALPKLKTYGDFDVTSVMMPCGAQLIGNGGFVYLNPDYTAITCHEMSLQSPGEVAPSAGDIDAVNKLYPPLVDPHPFWQWMGQPLPAGQPPW